MIAVSKLALRLGGRDVLREVSATFERGKVTAIIGPNGAGKTSLLRAIAGLISAERGGITIDDVPLETLSLRERARRIGYLAQDVAPAWAITARELVAIGRLPHRTAFASESAADSAAIEAALTATDTAALSARAVDTLSGGELARVKLARVLAGDPDWILADEPLANLDPPHQRDVLALLRAAARDGKGVIVILHQFDAALRVSNEALLLREGAVVASGIAGDVIAPAPLQTAFGMAFERVEGTAGPGLLPL